MVMTSPDCYKDVGGASAANGTPFTADILLDQFSVYGPAYIIILDCQKKMNDRGSCKHRSKTTKK
jgi:hypothetical protein